MSYHTGIIQPAPQPASALFSALHPLIAAHPAWFHVKDVTIGAVTYRVYGNNGNDDGLTFYVVLQTSTTNVATFQLAASEGFNSNDNTLINPVSNKSTAARPVGPDGEVGDNNPAPISGNQNVIGLNSSGNMSSEVLEWFLGITNNGLVIGHTNNNIVLVAQLYEQFESVSPFPLMASTLTSSTANSRGTTYSRHPGRENQPASVDHFRGTSASPNVNRWSQMSGTVGGDVDNFYGAQIASRVFLDQSGSVEQFGSVRGLVRDVIAANTGSGVEPGDVAVINGDEHRLISIASQGLWFNADAL